MGTVPPGLLLCFIFILLLIQHFKRRKVHYKDCQQRPLVLDEESNSFEEILRDEQKQCNCVLKCRRLHGKCEMKNNSIQFVLDPAEFVHGDNRTSFQYTLQQFLHLCLPIIPVIDIITKVSITPERLQGYVMVNDGEMLITWVVAFFVLRNESALYFKAHVSRHSIGLLLFWTLAFIIENVSFFSWNSPHWWFARKTKIQEAEFGLFVARYVLLSLIFLLGLKGPGLYKPPKVKVDTKEEHNFLPGSVVRE